MAIIDNTAKDLIAQVIVAADGSMKTSGTIYAIVRLEDDGDADDGKLWRSAASWETTLANANAPTATHIYSGLWVYALPAGASNGHAGGTISYSFTDDIDSAPTVIGGSGEHYIRAEDPLTTSDALTVGTINANVITASAIADNAIDAGAIAADAITAAKIADDAIGADQIASGAIVAATFAAGAIDAAAIATDAIGSAELAASAVNKIWAGATGARSITLQIRDTGASAIPTAAISIYDSGNSVLITKVTANASGNVTVSLDDATYKLRIVKSGYSFTSPETLTVTADATESFTGTAIATSSPSDPSGCVVYGTLKDIGITADASETVTVRSIVPQKSGGTTLSNVAATTTTDANGYFEIELIQGKVVDFELDNAGLDIRFTVPSQSTYDIANEITNPSA